MTRSPIPHPDSVSLKRLLANLAAASLSLGTALSATVETSDAGKDWKRLDVRTVRPAKEADKENRFGGSANHTVDATGFFHLTKKAGKWWLVDPDGGLFIMKGVNSVQAKRVKRTDRITWAKETHRLLKDHGFNTLGRWSSPQDFQSADVPIPWCGTLGFMSTYSKNRSQRYGQKATPRKRFRSSIPSGPSSVKNTPGKKPPPPKTTHG